MTEPRVARSGPALFLLVMALGYAVYAADRTVLASVLVPLKHSLALDPTQVGLMTSAQYIGVLSVVLIAGHLSDRFGKWRIILAGVAVFSTFTWLISFAADFYQAFAFRLVSGVGEGIFWPVAMSAVANYFGGRKGFALGAFYVGFDAGGASGSAIGGYTYAVTADWRTAFFVAPLLGIAVVAGLLVSREAFRQAEPGSGVLSLGRDAVSLLRRPRVAILMAFALAATYPVAAWQTYLATYWNNVTGLSVPLAAYGYSAVLVAGGAGKLVFGRASDGWPRDRVLLGIASGASAMFCLFFWVGGSAWEGFGLALAASFFASAIFPVMQALASDSCGGRTGTALGLTTTFQSVATVTATGSFSRRRRRITRRCRLHPCRRSSASRPHQP